MTIECAKVGRALGLSVPTAGTTVGRVTVGALKVVDMQVGSGFANRSTAQVEVRVVVLPLHIMVVK